MDTKKKIINSADALEYLSSVELFDYNKLGEVSDALSKDKLDGDDLPKLIGKKIFSIEHIDRGFVYGWWYVLAKDFKDAESVFERWNKVLGIDDWIVSGYHIGFEDELTFTPE